MLTRASAGAVRVAPARKQASLLSRPAPALGNSRRPATVLKALGPDHIHISESAILLTSAAAAVGLPFLSTQQQDRKPQEVAPAAAKRTDCIFLDVRTQIQRQYQGLPAVAEGVQVVQAPFLTPAGGGFYRKNPHFGDDVMFAVQAAPAGTTLVIIDMSGEVGMQAAGVVAKLGSNCRIEVVKGGFTAWQDARLPCVAPETQDLAHMDPSDLLAELEGELYAEPIFRPKLLDVLADGYTQQDLQQDVMSGLAVGVIALSLSMALGIASESTPAVGLTTAVVSGFLVSLLGGSRVCIGGPTAAFIPIVVGVAHQYGAANLVVCTGLSGAMLIAAGVSGLGSAIRFIPKPVVTGFTAGIATYILSTQVKDFLGLGVPGALPEGEVVPSQFLEKLYFLGSHLDGTHLPSLALATACFALMLAWPKAWAKVAPPQIVAVVAGTLGLMGAELVAGGAHLQLAEAASSLSAAASGTAAALQEGATAAATAASASAGSAAQALSSALGIETIGSHYGMHAIPSGLPAPHLPTGLTDLTVLQGLVQPALSIALLGSIESLLCARVSDSMIGDKHNPNTELIAQGVANIASAAFGGLPATGALARTAANVRAGGRSPIAGCVHAATILAVMMVAAPAAAYIPLPALSAVLVMVAINMGEWRHFRELPYWPEKDAQLYLLSFCLTVMQDVAVAVELGMAAAVLLFVRDVTTTLQVRSYAEGDPLASMQGLPTSSAAALGMPPGPASSTTTSLVTTVPRITYGTDRAQGSTAVFDDGAEGVELVDSRNSWSTWAGSDDDDDGGVRTAPLQVPPGVSYLDVVGSLMFGAGQQLELAVTQLAAKRPNFGRPDVLVLSLSHMTACDVSGLQVLEDVHKQLHKAGVALVLVSPVQQPLQMMTRAGFLKQVGKANVHRTLAGALGRAEELAEAAQVARITKAREAAAGKDGNTGSGVTPAPRAPAPPTSRELLVMAPAAAAAASADATLVGSQAGWAVSEVALADSGSVSSPRMNNVVMAPSLLNATMQSIELD